jgi:hypothetical protein
MGNAASDTTTLTICTSEKTNYQYISPSGKCNERIYETRTWYRKGTAPSGTPGSDFLELRTCISKSTKVQVIRMRAGCNSKIQTTALWQRPVGPPVAPSITSVVMGVLGTATLNIAASVEDGGARVTSYLVTSIPGDITATFRPDQIKAARVSGLTPGNLYSFSVVAINSKGTSPASIASKPTLAPTIPKAPTITRVVATGTNTAQLTFTAPTNDGGAPITSYIARSNPGGLQTIIYQSASGTIDISNLTHSTSYTFTLTAINDAGASPESAVSTSITTATPPPPPVPVEAVPTPTPAPTPTLSTISVAAIAGVTPPVTGAIPVTTTTVGTGYTGTISWASSAGALLGNFETATVYTATITLTPTSGYTLTGVAANFFTVAGANPVTNSANSGVVTAVFYMLGSTGPGGGKIAYVASSPFACGPNREGSCTYLEAAPRDWSGSSEDPKLRLAEVGTDLSPPTASLDTKGIGWGYLNTLNIINQFPGALTLAAARAASYSVTREGLVYDDWYLPSRDELVKILELSIEFSALAVPNVWLHPTDYYWSSSLDEGVAFTAGLEPRNDGSVGITPPDEQGDTRDPNTRLRPVRAF